MNKYSKQTILWSSLLIILLGMQFIQPSLGVTGSGTNTISGTATLTSEGAWNDNSWFFFRTSVEQYDMLKVEVNYQGSLDLDVRLYVDETNAENQQNQAWDITHCGFNPDDHVPTRYSEVVTNNTVTLGEPEQIEYVNDDFAVARYVYILVFVQSGVGSSNFTITSTTNELDYVPSEDTVKCSLVQIIWIAFIVATTIITLVAFKIIKVATRTEEQKQKLAQEKEEKRQKALAKAKGKGKGEENAKAAMKARRSTAKRR